MAKLTTSWRDTESGFVQFKTCSAAITDAPSLRVPLAAFNPQEPTFIPIICSFFLSSRLLSHIIRPIPYLKAKLFSVEYISTQQPWTKHHHYEGYDWFNCVSSLCYNQTLLFPLFWETRFSLWAGLNTRNTLAFNSIQLHGTANHILQNDGTVESPPVWRFINTSWTLEQSERGI